MKYKYTKEQIELAVRISTSWAETCRNLNIKNRSGNQAHLKKRALLANLDFSHFKGKSWSRDKKFTRVSIEDYLSNKKRIHSHSLKKRLIKDGIKEYKCEICKLSEWRGKPIVLELDHIDSNHENNNLNNLQIICPNCHAQETRERIIKNKKVKLDKRTISKPKLHLRKTIRPCLDELLKDILNLGYNATGRKYNVSDNSIRKWVKWESAGMVDNSVLETEAK